jgi:hypothetical protein
VKYKWLRAGAGEGPNRGGQINRPEMRYPCVEDFWHNAPRSELEAPSEAIHRREFTCFTNDSRTGQKPASSG